MSGISGIYILDHKKRVLIGRDYRGDLQSNAIELFTKKLLELDENTCSPLIVLEKEQLSFFFKRINNLIFVLISKTNSNGIMMFTFIYKLSQILQDYFKEIDEETIRDNFVIIYELLDEMMDNGYPQTTESKVMSEFIKTEKLVIKKENKKDLSSTLTNVVSWRPPNITYKKNIVYLDVIENINMQINSNGNVIQSEILGQMMMKTQLSGMPELKLGINDKVLYELQGKNETHRKSIELNDLKFHSCVRLSKFQNERIISFIPPDGEFQLMSYRLEVQVKPLLMVTTKLLNWTSNKIEFMVEAKSNFKSKCIANDVSILVPLPSDAQEPKFTPSEGKAIYKSEQESIQWNITSFPGHREISMKASVKLPSVVSGDRDQFLQKPIEVSFEIPYFTVSGILIRYLKIEDKSGYKASPFVRYISKNGKYFIRTGIQKPTQVNDS